MTLSRRWENLVRFAEWCRANNVTPRDAAELHLLAHRAFLAGTREANTGTPAEAAQAKFETKAKELGFRTSWPGLYPKIHRRGRDIYLGGF